MFKLADITFVTNDTGSDVSPDNVINKLADPIKKIEQRVCYGTRDRCTFNTYPRVKCKHPYDGRNTCNRHICLMHVHKRTCGCMCNYCDKVICHYHMGMCWGCDKITCMLESCSAFVSDNYYNDYVATVCHRCARDRSSCNKYICDNCGKIHANKKCSTCDSKLCDDCKSPCIRCRGLMCTTCCDDSSTGFDESVTCHFCHLKYGDSDDSYDSDEY